MLEDTLEMEDDEELEEEADEEVDKVLLELTDGKLGQAGSVGTGLPVSHIGILQRNLLMNAVVTGQTGRGGNGAKHGEVSATVERTVKRMMYWFILECTMYSCISTYIMNRTREQLVKGA